jgi:hypothetical protein
MTCSLRVKFCVTGLEIRARDGGAEVVAQAAHHLLKKGGKNMYRSRYKSLVQIRLILSRTQEEGHMLTIK